MRPVELVTGTDDLIRQQALSTGDRQGKTVRILGTHGVPGNYGGFETAAEHVAKHLVRHGWRVIVYCQQDGEGPITYDTWEGIERVHIQINTGGWRGTVQFDWTSIDHACEYSDICLTFGYNTGIFNFRQRLKGLPNVINMDGIEWSRKRWGFTRQAMLYINERFAALFGNHLIADHPQIHKYLLTRAPDRKISTVTYGANPVEAAPPTDEPVGLGLEPDRYFILIARPIPENSIIDIVKAFSRAPRGYKLLILGDYRADDAYHAAVRAAASDEVVFPGAIYGDRIVPLRYHAIGYFHGHTVGGTNPSLVEALAAGNPVLAHNNVYNRWVADDAAVYFDDEDSLHEQISTFVAEPERRAAMGAAARRRFVEEFTWERVAGQYEEILDRYLPRKASVKPIGDK